ncbi:Serine/threonine-protein kinase Sgk2 [Coemansia sp. RSA 1365]|nr:Serine/threonine-protein kinase Sgk2 [Coemansia sp. RSA 1365]
MDARTTGSGAIPSALRHLLSKGSKQHAPQIDGIVPTLSKPTSPMQANIQSPPGDATLSSPYYAQQTLVATDPSIARTRASLDTTSQQRSGNSTIGAWLSRYSLRAGGSSRASANSTASTATTASSANTITTAASELARHSIDSTLAAMQLGSQAFAAVITGVELREHSVRPSASSTGLRAIGVVTAARKRHVVYRILVSGRDGQWWVIRRYSEFHELCAILKRHFPLHAPKWADIFPSKRFGQSPSVEVAAQWTDRLNAFLRAVTADTDVCPCDEIQRFLRENAPPPGILSPAPDLDIPTAASRMPLTGEWPPIHTVASTMTPRDPMGRVSMPALKESAYAAQMATPPTSGPRLPPIADVQAVSVSAREAKHSSLESAATAGLPAVPPRPNNHSSLGSDVRGKAPFPATLGINERGCTNSGAASPVLRKTSDSLLYLSAEKRPNMEPLTMRKKYGLRANVQYVNNPHVYTTEQGPEPKSTMVSEDDECLDTDYEHPPTMGLGILADHDKLVAAAAKRRPPPPPPPALEKAKSWNASTAGNNGDTDVEMRAEEQKPDAAASPKVRDVQQAQLFHQQRKMPGAHVKGTVNTLMSALATDPQRSGLPPTIQVVDDSATTSELATAEQRRVSLDDFQLLSIIGKGSYGKVMLARYKDTGKVMAIKVISKSKLRGRPNEIRRVMSERKVLERTVEHPFLVGLQCAFQTKEKLFFCLDYVNGGELFFHLQRERRFSENRARFYAAEITCALEYLHGMGVVYRDLKPENCLLDADGHVKIVDFGLAKEVGPVVWRTEGSALYSVEEGGKTGTFCGTPEYLAPEVLLRQRYGKEVDWYCLGAVLYEMLTGLPPFYDQDNNTMYRRILHEPLHFPASLPPPLRASGTYNDSCSSGTAGANSIGRLAQDFITRILERDPEKRLGHGVFGTENIKRHVFFHGIDWKKIYRQEYAPPYVPKVSSIFDLSNIDPEFRNEPIPESILSEGQVDIIAEAAEAERQADLVMQSQLMAFPSPLSTPSTQSGLSSPYFQHQKQQQQQQQPRMGVTSPQSLNAAIRNTHASAEQNGDSFQGFSFVSPWVNMPDDK